MLVGKKWVEEPEGRGERSNMEERKKGKEKT